MINDIDYHMQRSRFERDLAYRYGTGSVADAHMALSELHLQQALALQQVQPAQLGNVTPLRRGRARNRNAAAQRQSSSAPAG